MNQKEILLNALKQTNLNFQIIENTETNKIAIILEIEGFLVEGKYKIFYDCENLTELALLWSKKEDIFQGIQDDVVLFFDFEQYGEYLDLTGLFFQVEEAYAYVEIII